MIKSISLAEIFFSLRRENAIRVEISELASSLETICRFSIPVLERIHLSDVSTIFSRSWLVMTFFGVL